MINNIIKSDTFVFQYWYPKFSYICWVGIQLFVYFFDSRYLLTYFVVGLIWLTMTHSPWWTVSITPLLEQALFSVNHLHPLLQRGIAINILSSDDIGLIRNINGLLQEDKDTTLAHTKESYNIASKGMIASYQDAVKGTAFTLQWLEVICDFFEKLRNLFQWEDPNMTYLFLIMLVVLFLFVTFLPLRIILSLATFYKFYKGQQWQKKRNINNQEVCKIEMEHFFFENRLPVITNYQEPWTDMCKKFKDNDYKSVVKLEKKMQQYF